MDEIKNENAISKGPDWNEIWKEMRAKNRECKGGRDSAVYWDDLALARRYLQQFSGKKDGRIRATLSGIELTPESRVLDVGSGPGILAVPLATRVRHVTAVDPSAAMLQVLGERTAQKGIVNIDCVHGKWDDIEVERDLNPPYDAVFASMCLGMHDLAGAISKMIHASSRYIVIVWFAGSTSWEAAMTDLWPVLHGRVFQPLPKADVVFNLLYSQGIFPHTETFPLRAEERFPSIDAGVDYFSSEFYVETDRQKEMLRDYLNRTLTYRDGGYVSDTTATCMKIWWEKGPVFHQNIQNETLVVP